MASNSEFGNSILELRGVKIPDSKLRTPSEIFAETPLIIRPISPPGSCGTRVGPGDPVWTMRFGIDPD